MRLRKAREHAGLSGRQLAEQVGRCSQTIFRYEWGEQEPALSMVRTIARVCGVSPTWLLTGDGSMVVRQCA
jgi:ribosome-binding protein aMBF1 (putative translation factor)